MVIMYKNA